MGVFLYNCDSQYLVEKINNHQQLTTQTTVQPFAFAVGLQSFFRPLTTLLEYCIGLHPKYMCEQLCGARISLIFGHLRICVVSECGIGARKQNKRCDIG